MSEKRNYPHCECETYDDFGEHARDCRNAPSIEMVVHLVIEICVEHRYDFGEPMSPQRAEELGRSVLELVRQNPKAY